MTTAGSTEGVRQDPREPVGLSRPKALSEGGTPEANPCGTDQHPGGTRPAWLWFGYHCTFEKQLRRDYGLSCADYWRLFDAQGGVCDRCKGRPGSRRLVVDEDDTSEVIVIRGLLHFACNRKVDRKTARYVLDPTGPKVGPFVVSAERARRRRRRLDAKKKEGASKQTQPAPIQNGSYRDKVRAARQAIEGK